MHFIKVAAAATALLGSVDATFMETDVLAAAGIAKLGIHVALNGYPKPKQCTLENVSVRREWSFLTRAEKLNYIDAVNCLAKKPAKTPAAIAAGAKTRYDDFVVTHIIQTLNIHGTGNFLAWHRYYTWAYEQVLRNECGYKGYQPYYSWPWWASDPTKSPVFDGSATSLSGDGAYVAGRNASCLPSDARCFVTLQPGNGGGCVDSGPMKNWKVNMGPLQNHLAGVKPNPQANGLGYNPRCLSRDISKQAASETTDEKVAFLIKNSTDIKSFQDLLQNFVPGSVGIHSGGHYTIGGDAGSDLYNSPADPAFFLHHGMVDRVWWIWQNLDLEKRTHVIAGTLTFLNQPPSRDATLQDELYLGHVGFPNITVDDATSTLSGPFCYIYA
ncbi:hypothetical protein EKO04_003883 [Ascochyta lentis]|uniref:Tyrosinase copper-binding domain-containing protein n=1 Tax=Ascochyta lentis TaxID=205686 RepID=A0A8H7J743_9PLEO|nr:hypothetical protein EKO04_003883 [Ascochyta lentis]